jgi:hypothetical protein
MESELENAAAMLCTLMQTFEREANLKLQS